MRFRVNRRGLLTAALALGLGAATGCLDLDGSHDEGSLLFDGRVESADGSGGILRVRFAVDEEWKDGIGESGSIWLYGYFDGGRGTHTVKVAVTDQASSPRRYRITGTLSYVESTGLLTMRTLGSASLPGDERVLETNQTVIYTLQVP